MVELFSYEQQIFLSETKTAIQGSSSVVLMCVFIWLFCLFGFFGGRGQRDEGVDTENLKGGGPGKTFDNLTRINRPILCIF